MLGEIGADTESQCTYFTEEIKKREQTVGDSSYYYTAFNIL